MYAARCCCACSMAMSVALPHACLLHTHGNVWEVNTCTFWQPTHSAKAMLQGSWKPLILVLLDPW